MSAYMEDNPQGKHGSHTYALADYGLTSEQVRARYGLFRALRVDKTTIAGVQAANLEHDRRCGRGRCAPLRHVRDRPRSPAHCW